MVRITHTDPRFPMPIDSIVRAAVFDGTNLPEALADIVANYVGKTTPAPSWLLMKRNHLLHLSTALYEGPAKARCMELMMEKKGRMSPENPDGRPDIFVRFDAAKNSVIRAELQEIDLGENREC